MFVLDVYITEMPVLESCLYYRDICLYQRDVCTREVSRSERYPYMRGNCVTEVSALIT